MIRFAKLLSSDIPLAVHIPYISPPNLDCKSHSAIITQPGAFAVKWSTA